MSDGGANHCIMPLPEALCFGLGLFVGLDGSANHCIMPLPEALCFGIGSLYNFIHHHNMVASQL